MPHRGFDAKELCKELEKAGFVKMEIKPAMNIVYQDKEGKDVVSERFMIFCQSP